MKRVAAAACRHAIVACICLLGACAASREAGAPGRRGTETLASLERRQVVVERDTAIDASRAAAIQAYRKFLDAAPRDRMRPEAMRRLGDLEIEQAREGAGESPAAREYRDAIKVYEDVLRTYPAHAGNDRVLYQLSHAYDQTGDLGRSLAALDRLVTQYPQSVYRDEAEFRRGELLFALGRFAEAEPAYGAVLQKGEASAFYERALFMRGWSFFKQGRLDEGLQSFFALLDRKLIGRSNGAALEEPELRGAESQPAEPTLRVVGGDSEEIPELTRAERELIDDTFRVVSLSLANLQGSDTIPRYFSTPARREYEFRVYQQLGELYFKQERVEDGAKALNAFARRYPTHPQSPLM